MKTLRPPRLSTAFSESGKSAKKRLGNILDTRVKRVGAVLIAAVVLASIAAGSAVALRLRDGRTRTPEAELSLAERLIATRHAYVGDASANGMTASALGIAADLGGFTNELQTGEEPYGWRLNFEKEPENGADKMQGYAAVLLALVDNLGYVEWDFGDGAVRSFSAEEASRAYGVDVKAAASSVESMNALLDVLSLHDYKGEIYRYLASADLETFAAGALTVGEGELGRAEKLNEFLNLCALKSHGSLDILSYTAEGYQILMRLVTDGERFWFGEYDGHDLNRGESPAYNLWGPYKHLKVTAENGYSVFYLVNDPRLEFDELSDYWLSSARRDPPDAHLLFFDESGNYKDDIY